MLICKVGSIRVRFRSGFGSVSIGFRFTGGAADGSHRCPAGQDGRAKILGRVRSSSISFLSCEEFGFAIRAKLELGDPNSERELRTVRFNDLAGDRFKAQVSRMGSPNQLLK